MKLYENKREVELREALVTIFTNNVPNHNIEYMISFDEASRLIHFGKIWTKKDISNWGRLTARFFIHQEYCPSFRYDDADIFLLDLFRDDMMKKYFGKKKFHVWEEVK